VSRAGTGPFDRSSAASRQNRSTSHGDEEEWEEAHDEQEEERDGSEDGRTQDREKESREEDSRKEDSREEKAGEASRGQEGSGPQNCRAQAGQEGDEARREAGGSRDEAGGSRAEAGSACACRAAPRRPGDGRAGPSSAVARHGKFRAAASRKSDGRGNAFVFRAPSGNATVITGVIAGL
jgi:hypothetical protein